MGQPSQRGVFTGGEIRRIPKLRIIVVKKLLSATDTSTTSSVSLSFCTLFCRLKKNNGVRVHLTAVVVRVTLFKS